VSTATPVRHSALGRSARSLFNEPMGGEPNRTTLEDVIAGVWEGLAVHGASACPVCGATMQARYWAHARPVDGRCADCGTLLT
jgi:hypothetical protein